MGCQRARRSYFFVVPFFDCTLDFFAGRRLKIAPRMVVKFCGYSASSCVLQFFKLRLIERFRLSPERFAPMVDPPPKQSVRVE
jgi:hypothetical protein